MKTGISVFFLQFFEIRIFNMLIIVLTLIGCSLDRPNQQDPQPRDEKELLIFDHRINLGEAYASSTVNVSIFRKNALMTLLEESPNAGQLVSYYDDAGYVKVLFRPQSDYTKKTDILIKPRLSDLLLGDGHMSISLGYSPDGQVHLFYGAHDTKPYYIAFYVSDIVNHPRVELQASLWPELLTYPQFYSIQDQLHLFYRCNDRDICMMAYNTEQKIWKNGGVLLNAGDSVSVYMDRLAIMGDQVALSWMYRLPGLPVGEDYLVVNDGLYLLKSRDGGISWFAPTGSPIRFPVPKGALSKIVDIPQNAGLINQNSTSFGTDGSLYMVHMHKDETGVPQIFLTVINQDTRVRCREPVSKNTQPFSLVGRGTLLLPLSRADVAVSERFIHVLYRENSHMIIASKPVGQVCQDTSWRYIIPDKDYDLGGWEPNYDLEAWNQKRRLAVYVQSARQGPLDQPIDGPSETAYLYIFKEFQESS